MASTLGDVLKPLGFAEEDAAHFSVQLTELATDLSSFNNIPMDEALQRLQGTLIGSHENALAFGVVINENVLKQKLLANGTADLTGKQLEQAKVQARIQLLMEGTTDAQGDAIRTSEGYANQQKALGAAFEDLQVVIGQALLPAATEFVAILKQAAEQLTISAGALGGYSQSVEETVQSNLDAATSMEDLIAQGKRIVTTYDDIGGAGRLVTGTNKGFQESAFATAKAIAVQSESFEEYQSAIRETFGDQTEFVTLVGRTEDAVYNMAHAEDEAARAANVAATEQSQWTARIAQTTLAQEEQFVATDRVSDATDELSDKMEQMAGHTGTAEQAIINENLAHERQFEVMQEAKEAARLLAEETERLAVESGDLFTRFAEGEASTESMGQSLLRMADQGGASAEQLALLAIATGELSEAEATALIQQVALEQSLAALGTQYADGTLSIDEYVTAANKAVEEVSNLTVASEAAKIESENLGAAAFEAAHAMTIESGKAQNLTEELVAIPGVVNFAVNGEGLDAAIAKVNQLKGGLAGLGDEAQSAVASGQARVTSGGGVGLAGGGVITGGIPGRDSVSASLMPGERVLSVEQNKAFESGGGGTSIGNITVNVQAIPGASAAMQGQVAGMELLNTLGGA
ncbi:MAG: hypothetical protein GY938_12735 [Ketobacter sp.]|nr:hypothetical protein [Ketobacter sp.]